MKLHEAMEKRKLEIQAEEIRRRESAEKERQLEEQAHNTRIANVQRWLSEDLLKREGVEIDPEEWCLTETIGAVGGRHQFSAAWVPSDGSSGIVRATRSIYWILGKVSWERNYLEPIPGETDWIACNNGKYSRFIDAALAATGNLGEEQMTIARQMLKK